MIEILSTEIELIILFLRELVAFKTEHNAKTSFSESFSLLNFDLDIYQ